MTTKEKIGYFNGDKVGFTGRTEVIHGGLFHEAVYLEGDRIGETCWVSDRIAANYTK